MRRVLVLGAGQIGTFAARAIEEAGAYLMAADLKPAPGYFLRFGPKGPVDLVEADILNATALARLIRAYAIDTIVLTVGLTGDECRRDPARAWEVNVGGSEVVARTALESGVRRLVFISTLAVYGRHALSCIDEDVALTPYSEYGRTKAAAEKLLRSFAKKGLDVRILRPCGIYGPLRLGSGSHSARFMEAFLLRALRDRKVTIQASGMAADEYLYVKDLGRAIALTTLQDLDGRESVFNVGAGKMTTAKALCSALRRIVPGVKVIIEPRGEDDTMPPMAALQVSRIRDVLGFKPAYSLIHGLTDYIQEARLDA